MEVTVNRVDRYGNRAEPHLELSKALSELRKKMETESVLYEFKRKQRFQTPNQRRKSKERHKHNQIKANKRKS